MERFVTLVAAGGVAMVIGLWVTAVTARTSPPWLLGVVVAVGGLAALCAGTYSELEV